MARRRSRQSDRPRRAASDFRVETLEPRVLFSADAALVAAAANEPPPAVDTLEGASNVAGDAGTIAASIAAADTSVEIVVVDADTPDLEVLLAELAASGDAAPELIVLEEEGAAASLARLGEILAGRTGLHALHLVSHGADGELLLGGERLTTLDLIARAEEIAAWRAAFADGADLLLYGCDVAASAEGRNFVDTLARLTGTDVAASVDATGATGRGGNWHLEYARGEIERGTIASAALEKNYEATLATFTVMNYGNDGAGSLRQAIEWVNDTNRNIDRIEFDRGGQTINLTSELPAIRRPVVIDATTAATGYSGSPLIGISGLNIPPGGGEDGFVLGSGSDGSTIRGLGIGEFSASGIFINGSGSHTIESNYIGTDGFSARGNDNGIFMLNSSNNTIGGLNGAQRNVIVANSDAGIHIFGGSGHEIHGNLIGINPAGTAAMGNGIGVLVRVGASGIEIGGPDGTGRNVISGNAGPGVQFENGSRNSTVQSNFIGTNVSGTGAVGNGFAGVYLSGDSGASANDRPRLIEIGGRGANAGNLISGNGTYGVALNNASAGNSITGNTIGTRLDGTGSLGDQETGVRLRNTGSTLVGEDSITEGDGSLRYTGNLISGNTDHGVSIFGAGATGNRVHGNLIGTDADGKNNDGTGATANGVGGTGVGGIEVVSGANGNLIGEPGRGNVISGNTGYGITVSGNGTDGNRIGSNYIGVDRTGLVELGNTSDGVYILDGAKNTVVEANIISGNDDDAIEVREDGTDGTAITGNYIGTDKNGANPIPNGYGVYLADGASLTVVEDNVLSGNGALGLFIAGDGTDGTKVRGNLIGVTADGLSVLGNGVHGIVIVSGPKDTVIGGDASAGQGNVISANGGRGISIGGAGTDTTTVTGNFIGTDRNGVDSIGSRGFANAGDGIVVYGGSIGTVIGGTSVELRNVVSGNDGAGIHISGTLDTVVRRNHVGLDANGAVLGNGLQGIVLDEAARGTQLGAAGSAGRNVHLGERRRRCPDQRCGHDRQHRRGQLHRYRRRRTDDDRQHRQHRRRRARRRCRERQPHRRLAGRAKRHLGQRDRYPHHRVGHRRHRRGRQPHRARRERQGSAGQHR